ncbi:DMT family transporter [Rhodanobacter aciditrophus]|uniref:DMT family transporter n=1 Tax=Rhodanobacter aciditrophus TaxID=1623218 RepID=A0ABW4AZM0_9GAMM
MQAYFMTISALLAFAANSILCRLALGAQVIDAASFTTVRILSGAMMLAILLLLKAKFRPSTSNIKGMARGKGSWSGALALFVYALGFSYAYVSLETGIGALILFGMVQFTIIAVEVSRGKRFRLPEWLGATVAFVGFVYLVLPTLSTPSFIGAVQMAIAGMAWGVYTLVGKGSTKPLEDTAYNFVRAVPMALIWFAFALPEWRLSASGIWLAVLSGTLASGIGYALWYGALKFIMPFQASVLQLSVPVIAAVGGIIWAGETLEQRLVVSALMILGGVFLVLMSNKLAPQRN